MPTTRNLPPKKSAPEGNPHELVVAREGVNCVLRYVYEQAHKPDALLECLRESANAYFLSAVSEGEEASTTIRAVERELASGTKTQYKPDCVGRHYYETLQDACEGAVKTMRRKKKMP